MKIKTAKLSEIKPNDANPRTINGEAFNKLCASINRDPQFMELRPIVIDEDGKIIGGNQRYRACQKLGMTEIPSTWVKKARGLTAEQRKRFMLVDNAPDGMSGEWDADILNANWDKIELEDLGLAEVLKEIEELPELKKIKIDTPPKMAWVLVGVPIGEWGKISVLAEAAAKIKDSIVETTANDGVKEN